MQTIHRTHSHHTCCALTADPGGARVVHAELWTCCHQGPPLLGTRPKKVASFNESSELTLAHARANIRTHTEGSRVTTYIQEEKIKL